MDWMLQSFSSCLAGLELPYIGKFLDGAAPWRETTVTLGPRRLVVLKLVSALQEFLEYIIDTSLGLLMCHTRLTDWRRRLFFCLQSQRADTLREHQAICTQEGRSPGTERLSLDLEKYLLLQVYLSSCLQVLVATGEQLATARQEVDVMRRLHHPNLLPLLDSAVTHLDEPDNPSQFAIYMLFPLYDVCAPFPCCLHHPLSMQAFSKALTAG